MESLKVFYMFVLSGFILALMPFLKLFKLDLPDFVLPFSAEFDPGIIRSPFEVISCTHSRQIFSPKKDEMSITL